MTASNSVTAAPSPEIVGLITASAALFRELQQLKDRVPGPLGPHLFALYEAATSEAPEMPLRDAALFLLATWYSLGEAGMVPELHEEMQGLQRAVNAAFYGERHQ